MNENSVTSLVNGEELVQTENVFKANIETKRAKKRVLVAKKADESALLGMCNIFKKGIGEKSPTVFFEEKAANDGFAIRRLGGQAPSAYTSTRGAAGALNALLLERVQAGATVFELENVVASSCLGKGGLVGKVRDKLTAHIKSFYLQADGKRASANGLVKAVIANGWNWNRVQKNAVLLDGKPWNGTLFNRSVTLDTIVIPVVLIALHYKHSKALEKALGIDKDD